MKIVRVLTTILVVGLMGMSGRGVAHASGSQSTSIDDPNASFTFPRGVNRQGDTARAEARVPGAQGLAKSCRAAVIGGNHVCLQVGQKCNPKYDTQYHRYGLHCHASRRLARRTGPPSQRIIPPVLHVSRRSSLVEPGYVFVAPKRGSGAQHGPEILDDRGRPVWFDLMPKGEEADDFRVQSYRGRLVLTWCQGGPFGTISSGADYIVDSSYRRVATIRAGHGLAADCHEFLLTPQGTALITAYQEVPYDLSSAGGPKDGQVIDGIVQEIDIATGRVLFEWHSLGHAPLSDSYAPVQSPYDYFIINAVNVDNDGNLLISGRGTWTVYMVDRHSGQILWRLGGKRSDFRLGPGAHFTGQHNPLSAGDNTIRLFDNGNDATTSTESDSRVIWVHLDQANKKATLVKTIHHPRPLSAQFEGNAQALANGDTFVGWGTTGYVSEFGAQGNPLFDAHFLNGYDTYRGYRFEWTGQPGTKPTATAWTNADGTTTVHAIWNGATDVAHWRILAGRNASALTPVRTVAWNGLDTTIKIAGIPRFVEVVALDWHGTALATSSPATAD